MIVERKAVHFVRLTVGLLLVAVGILSLIKFDAFVWLFSPLSADGKIQPHSWLTIRLLFASLLPLGGVLLLGTYLRVVVERLNASIRRVSTGKFLLASLTSALLLRLIVAFSIPIRLWSDFLEYHNLAVNWLVTGSYATNGLSTSYWPPGYPFFLSRIYLLFGADPLWGALANVLLSLAIVWLSYLLGRRIAGELGARWVLIIVALFPSQILFVNLLCSELLFTVLFLISLITLMSSKNGLQKNARWIILSGLSMGAATLVRPVTQLFFLPMIAYLLLRDRINCQTALIALLLLMGIGVVLFPWMVRNKSCLDTWALSTNGGVNLYIGNHPGAGVGWVKPDDKLVFGDPRYEVYSDSLGRRLALEYIAKYPLTFLKRGALKIAHMFAVDSEALNYELIEYVNNNRAKGYLPLAWLTQSIYLVVLFLGAVGLLLYLRQRRFRPAHEHWLMIGTVAYWIAIHFAFFGSGRFHFPLIPIIAIYAAIYLTRESEKAKNHTNK